VIPALGVYAALRREAGLDLPFPGGAPRVAQAIDAGLLARAIAWAGEAASTRHEIFNITNGDVFVWENIWPAIAASLGMRPGGHVPLSLDRDIRPARGGMGNDLRPARAALGQSAGLRRPVLRIR
jgi:nucleoside-diphosphate-sugar epimerase